MAAIAFLFDENVPGRLIDAVERHNQTETDTIDVVSVGDPSDLPLGADDPAILLWAEREKRILVTDDHTAIPGFLREHLAAGHDSPGVFLIRRGVSVSDMVSFLALSAHASDPDEWKDRSTWVPCY